MIASADDDAEPRHLLGSILLIGANTGAPGEWPALAARTPGVDRCGAQLPRAGRTAWTGTTHTDDARRARRWSNDPPGPPQAAPACDGVRRVTQSTGRPAAASQVSRAA